MGLEITATPPPGSAEVSAEAPIKGGGEVMADWSGLRFLTARAVVEGASGVSLRLPPTPGDQDLLDYPEEWQALARVSRELLSMRPILEDGALEPAPFTVPGGIEVRAWAYQGRRYVLLVNSSGGPLRLEESDLAAYRALYAVRSDPRELLSSCRQGHCLASGGVLCLEGRLVPEILP